MSIYIAYVYKDPDSSFGVSFPDVPGCYGAGESYEEAIENAKISLSEYAEAIKEDGGDMPKPRDHDELSADAVEAIEMKSAAFTIAVPLIVKGSKKRVNLSIDAALLAAIDSVCHTYKTNRSTFLADLAQEWLENKLEAVTVAPKKKAKKRKKKPVITEAAVA